MSRFDILLSNSLSQITISIKRTTFKTIIVVILWTVINFSVNSFMVRYALSLRLQLTIVRHLWLIFLIFYFLHGMSLPEAARCSLPLLATITVWSMIDYLLFFHIVMLYNIIFSDSRCILMLVILIVLI